MTSWTMSAICRDSSGVRTSCWVMRTSGMRCSCVGGTGTADRGTAGSGNCGSRDSADDRARRSDPGGLGGGEEGAGAALEALDLAEGRVLVLDVDVEARVHRGERRE